MRTLIKSLAIMTTLAASCIAFGAGGGSGPVAMPSDSGRAQRSPEDVARSAYNSGVRLVERGDDAQR